MFGFEVGGNEGAVGERGISGLEGSLVSLIAVDGICSCSALVPMAINVARERKVWDWRQMSADKDVSEATLCF